MINNGISGRDGWLRRTGLVRLQDGMSLTEITYAPVLVVEILIAVKDSSMVTSLKMSWVFLCYHGIGPINKGLPYMNVPS